MIERCIYSDRYMRSASCELCRIRDAYHSSSIRIGNIKSATAFDCDRHIILVIAYTVYAIYARYEWTAVRTYRQLNAEAGVLTEQSLRREYL